MTLTVGPPSYHDAIAELERRTQRADVKSPRPTLERMRRLAPRLGHPEHAYRSIHVTGTNGKSTTARVAAEILQASGQRVGLYTSPSLETVNERIAIDGEPISDDRLAHCVQQVLTAASEDRIELTYFEALTSAAFLAFEYDAIDVAVIEVGILGRFDATNIVDSEVAVVTNVGRDHLNYAGTVENVAREKAGIIKPGSIAVLGRIPTPYRHFFLGASYRDSWTQPYEIWASRVEADDSGSWVELATPLGGLRCVYTALRGDYQADNLLYGLAASEAVLGRAASDQEIALAAPKMCPAGRFEVLPGCPLLILDGAHNEMAAMRLGDAVGDEFGRGGWTVILAGLRGHDTAAVVEALRRIGIEQVLTCAVDAPRAMPVGELAAMVRAAGLPVSEHPTVESATRAGFALGGKLLATGSLYHLSAVRATADSPARARAEPGVRSAAR